MPVTDLALAALCGTQPRRQESADLAASDLSRSAQVSQRILRRTTGIHPYWVTIGGSPAFVWYRNAKVCTRSIYAALVAADVRFVAEHPGNVRIPPALLRRRFSFAFVRDPRTRLVSCWRNKVIDGNEFGLEPALHARLQDFDAFVQWVSQQDLTTCDKHFRLQSELIDVAHVDFIGRFESFATDFASVCAQMGIDADLEHRNVSSKPQLSVSRPTQDLIERLYEPDLRAFSY